MRPEFVIGVDIGTQGTKSAIFDVAGRCLAGSFEKSRPYLRAGGVVEEDPERQVASVCRTIRACVRESGVDARKIAAIGIDGQMAGIIGIERQGRAITPYDSWLDTRCAPYIARMEEKAGDEIVRKTGGAPSFNHGPKILWWMHERRRIFRAISVFVQPGGYAVMRLCGLDARAAFIDKTYLHFSGFADNRRGVWDRGLCQTFAVDPGKLPAIINSRQIVGQLAAQFARRCGLRPGVPVIAGCGDTAASFLACGATRAGVCVDVAGTASVFAATTKSFQPDYRHRTLACAQSAAPCLWHLYAYIKGGGMNLEWFRGNIAGMFAGTPVDYKKLEKMAAKIVPADDLPFFIPHLAGRVAPGWPRLRGAWAGLTLNHGAGHLYRALLESVALEYGMYLKILRELLPDAALRELRITGGGSASNLWNRIKADLLGCPVARIERAEGAVRGVAMLAGFGAGLFESLDAAARLWIASGAVTKPDARLRAYYAERLRCYARLLETINHWSEE